jgi:hypothetical protein
MVSKHAAMMQSRTLHAPAAWHANSRKSVPSTLPENKASSKVSTRAFARVSSLAAERPRTTNPDPDAVKRSTIGVLLLDRIDPQTFISPKTFLNPHIRAHRSAYPQMTYTVVSQGTFRHFYTFTY